MILSLKFDPIPFIIIALVLGALFRLKILKSTTTKIQKYKDILLPVIGFIHGVSNLGGTLLVLWSSFSTHTKEETRTLTAATYAVLAFSQLFVLYSTQKLSGVPIYYIAPSLALYFISSSLIFTRLSDDVFQHLLTILIFCMAGLLILKIF